LSPDPATQACRHLLYVRGLGEYLYESQRFRDIDQEVDDLPNVVCFENEGPSDIGETAFAPFDDELHLWGQEPQSPFDKG
jgi:hypothetical protein